MNNMNGMMISQVNEHQYNDDNNENRHIWEEITNESIEKTRNTLVGKLTDFISIFFIY